MKGFHEDLKGSGLRLQSETVRIRIYYILYIIYYPGGLRHKPPRLRVLVQLGLQPKLRKCIQKGMFWDRGGYPQTPKGHIWAPPGQALSQGVDFEAVLGATLAPVWVTLGDLGRPLSPPVPPGSTFFRVFMRARLFAATWPALWQERDEKEGFPGPSQGGL